MLPADVPGWAGGDTETVQEGLSAENTQSARYITVVFITTFM